MSFLEIKNPMIDENNKLVCYPIVFYKLLWQFCEQWV